MREAKAPVDVKLVIADVAKLGDLVESLAVIAGVHCLANVIHIELEAELALLADHG
jgi:hypothetical protein